jgi:hypothetical protein
MMNAPKYDIGSVIDLRFSNDEMPDRIYIKMAYIKDITKGWYYEVVSEKRNGVAYMSEADINRLISKKNKPCYDNAIIKQLYEDGFRFCGNNKKDTAISRANSMKNALYIKHIILAEALDRNGNPIPNYLGLWVQYNTTIGDSYTQSKHYVIK